MDPAEPRAVLDTALLERMRRENIDEPGLVDELLALFLEHTPPLMLSLIAHAAQGEAEPAGRIAHRLAGSARTLGAFAFGDACARLEEDVRTDRAVSLADRAEGIRLGFTAARDAIERYRR